MNLNFRCQRPLNPLIILYKDQTFLYTCFVFFYLIYIWKYAFRIQLVIEKIRLSLCPLNSILIWSGQNYNLRLFLDHSIVVSPNVVYGMNLVLIGASGYVFIPQAALPPNYDPESWRGGSTLLFWFTKHFFFLHDLVGKGYSPVEFLL